MFVEYDDLFDTVDVFDDLGNVVLIPADRGEELVSKLRLAAWDRMKGLLESV